MEQPIIKKKRGISPIWILPTVALCIGLWLLFKAVRERPIEITVHFHSAEGVTEGKTKVMYKGLPIGIVRDITVDKGMDTVSVIIEMDPRTKAGLVKDAKFWIVRPEIAAGRIRGLNTLLTGSYIAVQKGNSNEPCREFMGLDEPPPIPEDAPGLHIKLVSDALHSLQRESPIYYKNIKVGSIQSYVLSSNGTVTISAYIEPQYKHLVKPGSRFWNASGISVTGGINGLKLRMESLTTLINGGVAFYTPKTFEDQPPARNGHVFKLYKDYEDAQYGINVTLKIHSGEGLVENITKVIYHGLVVGSVKKISLDKFNKKYKVTAHLLLNPMVKPLLRKGTKFWVIRPIIGLGRVRNVSTLLTGPYITFVPGEGEPCTKFVTEGSHSKEIFREGVFYKLTSSDLHSLSPGAPIFFKHIQVGEVARYKLNPDNTVDLIFIIYDEYKHLINNRCVFWNYSGFNVKITPVSIDVNTDTLKSIASGGIAFDYPKRYYGKKLKPVPEGYKFHLFDSLTEAIKKIPDLKPRGVFVIFESKGPVPLMTGSPIFYKHIKVGEVSDLKLDTRKDKVRVTAFFYKKYFRLINSKTKFYCTSGVELKGSIRTGLKLRSQPIVSLVMGSISFFNEGHGKRVREWHRFTLYKDKESAKDANSKKIFVHFPTMQAIVENAKVRYYGIEIGYVKNIEIDKDLKGLTAELVIRKNAESLFTTDSKVWVVGAKFGLDGIKNLDTIVTGPFIAVQGGKGPKTNRLEGLSEPPSVIKPLDGLNIIVEAKGLGSLTEGRPVYYRQVKVGSVIGHRLSPDAKSVWIYLNIKRPYMHLVRANTKFWNASGIDIEAGIFSGVKVKTETVESILTGGVAFATPPGKKAGPPVCEDTHFKLYEEAQDEWLEW